MQKDETYSFWGGIVKSVGVVFGDIGTSPIYTLTVVFALTPRTYENVLGILSLIVWTLTILVTVEYAWLATGLGNKGQGGEIALREILLRHIRSSRAVSVAGILTFLGVSLLMGDGVITPAISILSAVEGMLLIPGLEGLGQNIMIWTAALVAVLLFAFQRRGTDRVAGTFGPIMVVWFVSLAVSGLVSLAHMPEIITAISPVHAVNFFRTNGFSAFFVLSEVILCATGGEALYADMGHLGRKPILRAWSLVFIALVINYLGQGIFALRFPEAKNLLFGMVQQQAPFLYIPFLVLALTATVIASQSIISGVFSIIYQGITTRILPLLKIQFTSSKLQGQIYLGAANWFLMLAVLLMIVIFKRSENLAAAYGLAVTGSMTITCTMMIMIFSKTEKWKVPVALAVLCVDLTYLLSTFNKLPNGAYWSLIIAAVPFSVIMVWTSGQRYLFQSLRPLPLDTFLVSYEQIYARGINIPGTALFLMRQTNIVSPYVIHCIIGSQIIYERNVFLCITRTDEPFGISSKYTKEIGTGLDSLEIMAGYMEVVDIEQLLARHGIEDKIIFYGIEDIITGNPVWYVYGLIRKITPNFVQFHQLPTRKLHGVITRVEM